MLKKSVELWSYWDWFVIRQGVKGANNRIQRSFAQGVITAMVPLIGACSIFGILDRLFTKNLSNDYRTFSIITICIYTIIIALISISKRQINIQKFETYTKTTINKYDKVAWIFTLLCIAAFISMGVIRSLF